MNQSELYPLFPTVVYKNSLSRKLSDSEYKYINSAELGNQYLGNTISTSAFFLDDPELNELKSLLMEHVNNYLTDIMMVDAELYITNSWLNISHFQQQHTLHNHNNSILSGVFYIKVSDSQPTISFNRMSTPFFLHMKAKQYTMLNSTEWNIPISDNDILIFPSQCFHYVKPNLTHNKRMCIAFNTFLKGNISSDTPGADLFLK